MKTSGKYVTTAHVSSESGDHYLMVLPGRLTDEEIKAAMDWEEPGCLYVQEAEEIEFIGSFDG